MPLTQGRSAWLENEPCAEGTPPSARHLSASRRHRKTFRPSLDAPRGVCEWPMALRIAFFGLPLAALLLARDGHDIALAALCRTRRGRPPPRRARASAPNRVLIKPDVERARRSSRACARSRPTSS